MSITAENVTAERAALALADPEGEREAVAPLLPVWAIVPPTRKIAQQAERRKAHGRSTGTRSRP